MAMPPSPAPSIGDMQQCLAERLHILLDLVSDDIWECDALLHLTGIHGNGTEPRFLEQLLGRAFQDLFDPRMDSEDSPRLQAALAERRPFKNCVCPIRLPTGESEWLRLSGYPVFSADGAFSGYLGTSTRITEERQRLTAERRRQQMESLGQLAGGVAHEFNNLLVPITMLSKLALPLADGNPTLRLYLETIHESGWKAAQIVRSVLTYARQMTPSREPVACGEVVADRIKLLRQATPPTVIIASDIADRTTPVFGNSGELSQIVVNLFTNASDAVNEQGTIRCSVRRLALTPDEAKLAGLATTDAMCIEIADTGPGIRPEIQDRIFEPFFTTKPIGQGTGLGLSVVDGIVKDWGGHIGVSNGRDGGACFTILLPVMPTPPDPRPDSVTDAGPSR